MGFLKVHRWPGILVFATAGLAAVAFAFVTVNLFNLARANFAFIQRHGWVAVMEGALLQLLELAAWGVLALICYLVFKICEVELLFRYNAWSDRTGQVPAERRRLRFRRRN